MLRLALAAILGLATLARAQTEGYTLGEDGEWVRTEAPAPGSDEAYMAETRTMIATGYPGQAAQRMSAWIRKHKDTDNPYLPRAYLLRADARSALGNEYKALYDYEKIIRDFPSSPEFVTSIERELAIGVAYVHGMKRRSFGLRIAGAERTGEKLLIRVDERMPYSQLAETAGIELADYYFRKGELEYADMAYELFLRFHPRSKYRKHALLQRVYASIGRFKGPKYDGTMLVDAELLIEDVKFEYPREAELANMDGLLVGIEEAKAAQVLAKARWYLKRDDAPSARFLLRRILRDFPKTVAAVTALDTLERRGWLQAGTTPREEVGPDQPPATEPAPDDERDAGGEP